MKRSPTKITLLSTLFLVMVLLAMPTDVAHAGIISWLYENTVLAGLGKVLGWSGVVFDWAMTEFVVGFGRQYAGGIGGIVELMWAQLRDLFNLTFIFGLVYIGFKMILRTDDGQTKRLLINIILAALLVNFSLFITKFVIDFSNILAIEIMNIEPELFGITANGEVELSESIANQLGVSTVFSNSNGLDEASGFTIFVGMTLVFIVGIYVIFSASLLLVIRTAALYLIMIVSPFLFIGMVLPTFKSTSVQIWKALFARAFFAPLYVLFLYITLNLSNQFRASLTGSPNFTEAFSTADGAAAITAIGTAFVPFILLSVFLIMSLVIAQRLGMEGADKAMSIGKKAASKVGVTIQGGALWGGKKALRGTKQAGLYATSRPRRILRGGFNRKVDKDGEIIPLWGKGSKEKPVPIMAKDRDGKETGKQAREWYGAKKYERKRDGGISGLGRNLKYWTLRQQQRQDWVGALARNNIVEDHGFGQLFPALEGAQVGFRRNDEAEQYMEGQTDLRAERRNQVMAGIEAQAKLEAIRNNREEYFTYDPIRKTTTTKAFSHKSLKSDEKMKLQQELAKTIAVADQAAKDTTVAEIKNMGDREKYLYTPFVDMAKYRAMQNDTDIDKTVRDDQQEFMRQKIKSSFLELQYDEDGKVIYKKNADGTVLTNQDGEKVPDYRVLTDELKKVGEAEIDVLGSDWAIDHMDILTNYQIDGLSKFMNDTSHTLFKDIRKEKQIANDELIGQDAKKGEYLPTKLRGADEVREFFEMKPYAAQSYKVKRVLVDSKEMAKEYGVEEGEYAVEAKIKGGKDRPKHIHLDVLKDPKTAAYNMSRELAQTLVGVDRDRSKINSEKRIDLLQETENALKTMPSVEEIETKINAAKAAGDKWAARYAEGEKRTLKKMQEFVDWASNTQGQKEFFGNIGDPRKSNAENEAIRAQALKDARKTSNMSNAAPRPATESASSPKPLIDTSGNVAGAKRDRDNNNV